MKEKNKQKGDQPSTLDSLLKLLPILAASYPGFSNVLGQLAGESSGNTGQVQEALPKITSRLAEMDQETKDKLAAQLLSFFPELEELIKRQ